jgi:predicted permease
MSGFGEESKAASFNIVSAATSKTIARNMVAGVYEFKLKVTDDKGLSAKDTVLILVVNPAVNQPPIANAGKDTTIFYRRTQLISMEALPLILIITSLFMPGQKFPVLLPSAFLTRVL